MIRINNISHSYEDVQALKNISLEVNEGELFGLIGPDGAGKTTLFRILTTLLIPNEGEAYMNGYHTVNEYKKIRREIGYMPGKFSLYPDLSVEENLEFFATVFNTTVEANYDLVKDIYQQIEPFKKRRSGKLSGGMKQKLALSCALIHKPVILVLDEPTTGVDAVSRLEFWEMLKKLKKNGITIIVSTPYMDEASLCDRIALIQNGELLQIDTPDAIRRNHLQKVFAIQSKNRFRLLNVLENYQFAHSVYLFGDTIHYTPKEIPNQEEMLAKYLGEKNIEDFAIKQITPTIEDCFMELMSKKEAHANI